MMPLELYYLSLLFPFLIADILMFVLFHRQLIREWKAFLATLVFFAGPWYLVVDTLALHTWKIWYYDIEKTLDTWVAGTLLEELLWTILVNFFFVAVIIAVKSRKRV